MLLCLYFLVGFFIFGALVFFALVFFVPSYETLFCVRFTSRSSALCG